MRLAKQTDVSENCEDNMAINPYLSWTIQLPDNFEKSSEGILNLVQYNTISKPGELSLYKHKKLNRFFNCKTANTVPYNYEKIY